MHIKAGYHVCSKNSNMVYSLKKKYFFICVPFSKKFQRNATQVLEQIIIIIIIRYCVLKQKNLFSGNRCGQNAMLETKHLFFYFK